MEEKKRINTILILLIAKVSTGTCYIIMLKNNVYSQNGNLLCEEFLVLSSNTSHVGVIV